MKVRTRLQLSFGVILVLFFAVGGLFIFQSLRTIGELKSISSDFTIFNMLFPIAKDVADIGTDFESAVILHDSEKVASAKEAFKKVNGTISSLKSVIAGMHAGDKSTLLSDATKLTTFVERYYNTGSQAAESFFKNDAESGKGLLKEFNTDKDDLDRFIETILKQQSSTMETSILRLDALIKTFLLLLTIAAVLSILIVFVLSVTLTSFVMKPLLHMAEVSNAVSEGDLTNEVTYRGKNIMGTLGKNLNGAITSLRNNTSEMKKVSGTTVQVKNELAASTEQTSSAVNEIAANNASMKKQVQNLNSNIMESSSSTAEIDANIKSLGSIIEEQAALAVQATASVNEMIASINSVSSISETKKDSIQDLVRRSLKGGEKMSETNKILDEVAGSIGNIQEMLTMINNIAAQTNLLSMNAAIEAAHAGDAGRGFSVVADEIRKLAENTAGNAKDIESVIGNIITNIGRATKSGGETKKALDEIQAEIKTTEQALNEISYATKELAIGGEEILKAMARLSDVSESSKTGAVEMQEGSAITAKAMVNVEHISSLVTNGMEEIALGIDEIAQALQNINEMTQKLGENSDNLDALVQQFKV